MNTLPESFIAEGLKLAKGATIMGKSFADMTRDELIAVAAMGWQAESDGRKEHMRQLDFLSIVRRHI